MTETYAVTLNGALADALSKAGRKAREGGDPDGAPMLAAAAAIGRRDIPALDRALAALLSLEAARGQHP